MAWKKRSSLALIGASVLVIGVASGFLYSRVSQFRFSEIEIKPEGTPVTSEIQRRLMKDLGKSLFSISLGEVERTLKEIPAVESVRLHRIWPTKLAIDVHLREAVAMVFAQGRLWSVSAQGQRIEPIESAVSLPLLKNFPELPEVGSVLARDERHRHFFDFLGRLRGADVGYAFDSHAISEFRWDEERGFTAWSYERGVDAELGFEHFDRAWRMLDRVLTWSNQNGMSIAHVDASFQTRVVVRTRSRLQNSQIGINLEELVRRKDPEAAVR